jgi:hypothetical protein
VAVRKEVVDELKATAKIWKSLGAIAHHVREAISHSFPELTMGSELVDSWLLVPIVLEFDVG